MIGTLNIVQHFLQDQRTGEVILWWSQGPSINSIMHLTGLKSREVYYMMVTL